MTDQAPGGGNLFRAQRLLTPEELTVIGEMGLVPVFAPKLSDRAPTGDQAFDRHIDATYPQTPEGYMGREHFWVMGDRTGITRKSATTLFSELCLPLRGDATNPRDTRASTVIQPEAIGLSRKERFEVGMPRSPIKGGGGRSDRALRHVEWDEARWFLERAVLQVEGLLELPRRDDLDTVLTSRARGVLSGIWPCLCEFLPDSNEITS